MSRIQRLGIGNGGMDCEISYMQGKKYPNAGDIVKPVQGVSNRTLLKNPYNTLNEPIANPGIRPERITTDNRGNVFARSETMLVPGVTNDTLLKNPNNIKSIAVGDKRTLSLQRIKDINNKMLPSYITENKGINEVMLQILTMIENKQVKLITIQLLKMLITKNVPQGSAHTEQKVLQALNYFDIVLTAGRRVFKENTLSPTKIPEALRPAVNTYIEDIVKLYKININANPPNIDTDIQTGLSELGLLSNALTRMFEFNNSIDPSNTLTRDQINAAAYSGFGQQPIPGSQQIPGSQNPGDAGSDDPGSELKSEDDNPLSLINIDNFLRQTSKLFMYIRTNKDLNMLNLFADNLDRYNNAVITKDNDTALLYATELYKLTKPINAETSIILLDEIKTLKSIPTSVMTAKTGMTFTNDDTEMMENILEKYINDLIDFMNSFGQPNQPQNGPQTQTEQKTSFNAPIFDQRGVIDLLNNLGSSYNEVVRPENKNRHITLAKFLLLLQQYSTASLEEADGLKTRIEVFLKNGSMRKAVLKDVDKLSKINKDAASKISNIVNFFFQQAQPAQSTQVAGIPGEGRRHRRPQNHKVVFQVGKQAIYQRY